MADREKVIKGLEYCSEGNCLGNDCPYKKYQATEWCRSVLEKDAIKLLKEQQHWIPISERKPKSNGVYIVSRWVSDGCERLILADASYFDGTDTWHDDTKINYDAIYDSDRIVAWMPLPEPYRTNT